MSAAILVRSATSLGTQSLQVTQWAPVVIGERFRLCEDNPLTGRPYATSRAFELPPYILSTVFAVLRVTSSRWDDLVCRGEVYTVARPGQEFSLGAFLREVRTRPRVAAVSPWTCEDCWGTLATHDYDASVTGNAHNVFLCSCTMGSTVVSSWH